MLERKGNLRQLLLMFTAEGRRSDKTEAEEMSRLDMLKVVGTPK